MGGFVGIGVLAEPDEKTDKYDIEAVKRTIGKQVVLTTGSMSEAEQGKEQNLDIQRKVLSFTIADVAETGIYQFDKSCVYLPIKELNERLYPDKELPVASQIHDADTLSHLQCAGVNGAVFRNLNGDFVGGAGA